MPRYVITPGIALELAGRDARIGEGTRLVAPTLIRSQVLARLYGRVRAGEMDKSDAEAHLDFIRALKIRLLGDRVLQSVAWTMAAELDWLDTFDAEYIALTKLQADALVTDDADLRAAASTLVPVALVADVIG